MTKETENLKRQKGKRLQWHPAFYASIQIELEEEADKLTFEDEHHLSTKPLQIDVLIIKKNTDEAINKNIGQIFRKHNIVEYKSPSDYLSVDDFYKVYAYGCLYKALATGENNVKVEELTITFVSEGYPRSMMAHLKKRHKFTIEQREKGIYYIVGDIIPMQLIVTSQLTKECNLWLSSLTDKLKGISIIERLSQEYQKHRKDTLYRSVMDIIVRANNKSFEEARDMCEALDELFKDKMEEKLNEKLKEKLEEKDAETRMLLDEKDLQIKELQAQIQMLKSQQA